VLNTPEELDALVCASLDKIVRATHVQDQLLSEKQVAARYEFLDVVKLRNMRHRGNGPRYLKMGEHKNSRVYYRLEDVEAWIVGPYQLEPFVDRRFASIQT